MATEAEVGASSKLVELYLVRISPPCRIVWLYLRQHNIPHTLVDVDLSKSISDLPDAIKKSPHLEVPILIDGEIVLFEAPSILNYLAVTYTGHVGYGMSRAIQALTDSLISWANSQLHRCIGYHYVYPQFLDNYSLPDQPANEVFIDTGIRSVSAQLEKLETRYLKKTPFLCGQRVTVADMFVASVLIQLEWPGFNFSLWPRVAAWLKRVKCVDFWDDVHKAHEDFLRTMKEQRYQFD